MIRKQLKYRIYGIWKVKLKLPSTISKANCNWKKANNKMNIFIPVIRFCYQPSLFPFFSWCSHHYLLWTSLLAKTKENILLLKAYRNSLHSLNFESPYSSWCASCYCFFHYTPPSPSTTILQQQKERKNSIEGRRRMSLAYCMQIFLMIFSNIHVLPERSRARSLRSLRLIGF